MSFKKKDLPESEFYHKLDMLIPGGELRELQNTNSHRKIYLSRISIDGSEEMYEYSKHEIFYQYLEGDPPKSIKDTEKYLRDFLDQVGDRIMGRTRMVWFVRRIRDSKIIGTISLVYIDYTRQMTSWGYGLGPQYWGKGYSLEMLQIMKKYAFEDLHLNRIHGETWSENRPVIGTLLSTGALQEGTLREYYKDSQGNYHDGWKYGILAEDYFTSKKEGSGVAKESKIEKGMIASLVSNILGENDIGVDDSIESVSTWDSLNHITIILGIQEKTGYRFSPEEISEAVSIDNIYKILTKTGALPLVF